MQRTQRDLLLGIVFFLALGLLLWATFNLGSVSVRKALLLEARFPTAAGLREGDPVQILGRKSGQVTSVRLDPAPAENRIVVGLQLDEETSLRSDALVAIRDSGLLGGKSIDIDPGRATGPLDLTKPWIGTTSRAPFDSLSETFAGEDNKANLSGALRGLRELLDNANNPKGSVGALLKERDFYDRLLDSATSLARILDAIDRGEGALGKLLRDAGVAEDLREIAAGVRAAVRQVGEGKSVLGRLFYDEAIGKDLADTVADVREITRGVRAGEGPMGVLFRDADVATSIQGFTGELREITRKVNDPKAGTVGALLGSVEWRDTFGRFLDNLASVSDAIRSGPGLLARVIHDRELGERFDRIFIQVSRALEDAREAAPVGTIIQVVGGIF